MRSVAQAVLLGIGAVTGVLLAYVDSLPTWDDSGIIAGSLILVVGLLTLLGCRRPWLAGLVVGIWIPLRALYLGHDYRMLAVLLFPLVGAYAGWLVRQGVFKTLDRT